MFLVITIIANPWIVRISSKNLFFLPLFAGLSLVVERLFYQQFYSCLPFFICSLLLLYQTSNHGHCKHHFVLWVHDDHGLDFLPFHR